MSKEIKIPDIGTANAVDVIAVMIKPGDTITVDMPLATLEGDKASMDIPANEAGVVDAVLIKVGDKVKEGAVICTMKSDSAALPAVETRLIASDVVAPPVVETRVERSATSVPSADDVHASPSIRRLARELDINLATIKGTGEKNRVTKDDIKNHLSKGNGNTGGFSVLAQPIVDFAKYGTIDSKPLSKIQKISGANLHRNWVTIPHVTQFIESDIS